MPPLHTQRSSTAKGRNTGSYGKNGQSKPMLGTDGIVDSEPQDEVVIPKKSWFSRLFDFLLCRKVDSLESDHMNVVPLDPIMDITESRNAVFRK